MNVSLYKNALDNEGINVNVVRILTGIKTKKWDEPVQYLRGLSKDEYDIQKKYKLPAATFSGSFAPTRHDQNIKSYTGIITIDLDHIKESLQVTKDKLREHPHVLSVFTSPSNEGLKILVLTDTPSDKHGEAFDYLKGDIKKHLGIDLDKSGRNLSRLCFVSSDPEMHINLQATPMPISQHLKKAIVNKGSSGEKINSKDEKIIAAENITRAKYKFEEGSRNHYIHYLSSCLNRLGVEYMKAYEYVVNEYSSRYSIREIRPSITSAYKNKHEFDKWTVDTLSKAPEIKYDAEEINNIKGESLYDILLMMAKSDNLGTGPKTYIQDVDDSLGGCMERGNLYGMIGRDGTFKSIMAMYICLENAKNGVSSIYFNMQMSKVQLVQRIIKKEIGVNILQEKRSGRMTEDVAKSLADKIKAIQDNMIIISDSNVAYTGLSDAIRREVAKKGDLDVQLIVIDDIGDMADESGRGDMAVIENSRNLKELAKKLNVAIIVLSHTRSDCSKHIRNTGPYVRGGLKLTGNMDGYFCHSLLIDPITNDNMGEDIVYREGIFYMKFIDKRGAGAEVNKLITIGDNISVDVTDLNPNDYEIKLKR